MLTDEEFEELVDLSVSRARGRIHLSNGTSRQANIPFWDQGLYSFKHDAVNWIINSMFVEYGHPSPWEDSAVEKLSAPA